MFMYMYLTEHKKKMSLRITTTAYSSRTRILVGFVLPNLQVFVLYFLEPKCLFFVFSDYPVLLYGF